MSKAELAERTGLSRKHVNQLVNGTAPLSPATALALDKVTGLPAHVWTQLEAAHQAHRLGEAELRNLERHTEWVKRLPVKQMIDRGVIAKGLQGGRLVRELLRFFAVAGSPLAGAAQRAAFVFGQAAPDAGVLVGVQRPLQALGARLAASADGLGLRDLVQRAAGHADWEEHLGFILGLPGFSAANNCVDDHPSQRPSRAMSSRSSPGRSEGLTTQSASQSRPFLKKLTSQSRESCEQRTVLHGLTSGSVRRTGRWWHGVQHRYCPEPTMAGPTIRSLTGDPRIADLLYVIEDLGLRGPQRVGSWTAGGASGRTARVRPRHPHEHMGRTASSIQATVV